MIDRNDSIFTPEGLRDFILNPPTKDEIPDDYNARRQAAIFFNLATSLKIPRDSAIELSRNLTQLADDVSKHRNVPSEAVAQDITSGLIGNGKALTSYGVVLDSETLKERAYREGISAKESELNKQQKILAAYKEITEKLS